MTRTFGSLCNKKDCLKMTSEAQQVKTIPTSVWNKKGLHACTNNKNSSCSGLDLMSLSPSVSICAKPHMEVFRVSNYLAKTKTLAHRLLLFLWQFFIFLLILFCGQNDHCCLKASSQKTGTMSK